MGARSGVAVRFICANKHHPPAPPIAGCKRATRQRSQVSLPHQCPYSCIPRRRPEPPAACSTACCQPLGPWAGFPGAPRDSPGGGGAPPAPRRAERARRRQCCLLLPRADSTGRTGGGLREAKTVNSAPGPRRRSPGTYPQRCPRRALWRRARRRSGGVSCVLAAERARFDGGFLRGATHRCCLFRCKCTRRLACGGTPALRFVCARGCRWRGQTVQEDDVDGQWNKRRDSTGSRCGLWGMEVYV